jgi:hypothetical protein
VLLDEETAAFFAARLPEGKAKAAGGESDGTPSKKRKKLASDSGEASKARDDAVEDITLRVACLDGSSLELTVPPRELVHEVKRAIGQVRRRLLSVLSFARLVATTLCFDFHSRLPARRRCGVCQRPFLTC